LKKNLEETSASISRYNGRGEKSKLADVDPPNDSEYSEDEFDRMSQVNLRARRSFSDGWFSSRCCEPTIHT